ncbi:uncharacterized protein LOC106638594 [Copidosoma floridanum]|uniref:uncharacterized protein LOC106638594 n=1 Tax=Copidosoma floridanum TaxID=29053 RepID=UPI0006C98565|nr:uncharacterized protein LOC106638594 [Copidosoma floridanum]
MLRCLCVVVVVVVLLPSPPILASPRLAFANESVLLFPQPTSVFQFTIGVSVPIVMSKKGGIVFSVGFQFNYALPMNLSQLEPMVIHARADDPTQLSLAHVYASIEGLLERYGWREGRSCLLRTICELADTPIDRTGTDIVEEIIHLLLTPSEDGSNGHGWTDEARLYEEAEWLGSQGGTCSTAYRDCVSSPLDYITELAAFG